MPNYDFPSLLAMLDLPQVYTDLTQCDCSHVHALHKGDDCNGACDEWGCQCKGYKKYTGTEPLSAFRPKVTYKGKRNVIGSIERFRTRRSHNAYMEKVHQP